MHIILLGDSLFDNAAYVKGSPDVCSQLKGQLPSGWQAMLLARDGSLIHDVPAQLARLPSSASHLVLSMGGNDALGHMSVLSDRARSIADVLERFASISEDFGQQYAEVLDQVLQYHLPTVLCTIYYPRFPDRVLQRLAVTALALFNDCIIREAFRAGAPLLDLRLICNQDADYANALEPSTAGGAKIARSIIRAVRGVDFSRGRTEVFTSAAD